MPMRDQGESVPKTRKTLAGRAGINLRVLQIFLGSLWIIDGLLQAQPKMFGSDFVKMVVLPNSMGQPGFIGSLITWAGHLMLHGSVFWNASFVLVQIGIGVGIISKKTTRFALLASIGWAAGVWFIGEGFGMVLTGTASPLTGAPGAVFIYGIMALIVYPRKRQDSNAVLMGIDSSASGDGLLGSSAVLILWALFWIGNAFIWLEPANRYSSAVKDQIHANAQIQPAWFGGWINHVGSLIGASGGKLSFVLAATSVLIGFGPLFSARATLFFNLGIALSLLYWVFGQGLGGILTGMGTDPNMGPIFVLFALSITPLVVPFSNKLAPPIGVLARIRPTWLGGAALVLFAVPSFMLSMPVNSSGSQMAASMSMTQSHDGTQGGSPSTTSNGMNMASSSTSPGFVATGPGSSSPGSSTMGNMPTMSGTYPTSTSQASQNYVPSTTMGPMIMSNSSSNSAYPTTTQGASGSSSMPGMDMGSVDSGWTYKGPALSETEVNMLNYVTALTDEGHVMQTPNCTEAPTAQQEVNAARIVQETTAAVQKYQDVNVAIKDGYTPITDPSYPVVHYVNAAYMQSQYLLDPNHIQSLVYATIPSGQKVLVAAMYLTPYFVAGPMPGGCLTQWHMHSNLCMSDTTGTYNGFAPCGPGTTLLPTPWMFHVWQAPVPGGPLAMDPTDLQTVQAAIMEVNGVSPTS